ncbi:MAG: FAD-dependent oxidoreductase [Collinsella sp.]
MQSCRFQTNLTFGEQKRVFRMIPGLENAGSSVTALCTETRSSCTARAGWVFCRSGNSGSSCGQITRH